MILSYPSKNQVFMVPFFRNYSIMELSVIIPAKNEEQNIEATVRSVFSYLSSRNISHEIIVVANDCTDRTDQVVDSLVSTIPTLLHIKFSFARGKGYAVRKGMLAARGALRLFMDADNSTNIDNFERFKTHIDQGYDVIIGSIGLADKDVKEGSEPWYRQIMGKAGNLFIQALLTPGIHDTQRGFKMLTARAADKIFPKMKVDGFAFDVELLALARKNRFKIKELSVKWSNNMETSKVTLVSYLEVLLSCVKIKWDMITGLYNA